MAYKLTKVNNDAGRLISLDTNNVDEDVNTPEAQRNLYYTTTRADTDIGNHRTQNPTFQDKHFYTTGAVQIKQGDLFWNIVHPITIVSVSATLKTAPVGSNLTFYVQKNGGLAPADLLYDIDILSSSTTAASNQAPVTLQSGDYLQVDIASIGSQTSGSDLIVSFKYYSHL
tara:strand:- start:395 stop:907 length:513 start_codon:yes stop_codon:yes gene_type:complete